MGTRVCQKRSEENELNSDHNIDLPNSNKSKKNKKYDCIQIITHHKCDVTCLIVLNDSRLVSGSLDNTIVIWKEGPKHQFLIEKILEGHSNSVISLSEMLNNILCSSSVDKTLRLWKLSSMKCYKILHGHEDSVLVSLQLQNEFIVSGADDRTIRIWGLNKKKNYAVIKILEGHHKPISTLIAIEDKDKIVSGSDDGTVRFWSIEKMECVDMIDYFNKSEVYCIKVDRDKLIVACGDGNVYFITLETLIKTQCIQFSKFGVIDFFISLSERIIGFACADGRARIWKMGTKKKITIKGHTGVIKSLKRLVDGKIVTCSQDNTIKIWKVFLINLFDEKEEKERENEEESVYEKEGEEEDLEDKKEKVKFQEEDEIFAEDIFEDEELNKEEDL